MRAFQTILVVLFLCSTHVVWSQVGEGDSLSVLPHKKPADTLAVRKDTSETARPTERNPKRAALMSAVVPGLGQIYNKKYWKLPLVYGALGTAGYFVVSNRQQFFEFKEAYAKDVDLDDGDVSKYHEEGYTLNDLQSSAEQYQSWMEYSAVAFLAAYTLQVVDAAVDAHLFYFDVSEDLSLRVEPNIQYTTFNPRPINGLTLSLTF